MSKLSFLAGFGAGYVLGARAGEQRYEQIKKGADKAWHQPAVQKQVTAATGTIKERGPQVAAAAGQATIKGLGATAKNAATAGLHAATGKRSGEVVQGQVARVDDPKHPSSVGFAMPRHGLDQHNGADSGKPSAGDRP